MATHQITYQFVVPVSVNVDQKAVVPLTESFSLATQSLSDTDIQSLQDTLILEDGFPFIVPLQDDIILKDDEQAIGRDFPTIFISDPRYFKKNVGGQ